jgi:hypothetical protein
MPEFDYFLFSNAHWDTSAGVPQAGDTRRI